MPSSQASSSKVTLDQPADDVDVDQFDRLPGAPDTPNGYSNHDRRPATTRPSFTGSNSSSAAATPLRPSDSIGSSLASFAPPSHGYTRPLAHPQISRLRSSSTQVIPKAPNARRLASDSTTASAFRHGRRMPSFASSYAAHESSRHSSAIGDLPTDVVLSSSAAQSDTGATSTPFPPASDADRDDDATRMNTFKWNTLKRISARACTRSEEGEPTVLAVKGLIVIGTTSGWTLVFDFSQSFRCRLGTDSISRESGSVTAVNISPDQTFIAVGHANGAIHLYSLSKPGQPQRSVLPTTLAEVNAGRREGHLEGSTILRLGFAGARHTAIVATDDQGLAFYHSLGKVLILSSNDVIRILGRYPEQMPAEQRRSPGLAKRSAPIADMATLPFGTVPHPSDELSLAALVTPSKLVVVGLRPNARTWWRSTHSKATEKESAQTAVLAWYPSVGGTSSGDVTTKKTPQEDPVLAYAWDQKVHFVAVRRVDAISRDKEQNAVPVRFEELEGLTTSAPVLGLQWFNRQIILVETAAHVEVWDARRRVKLGSDPFESTALLRTNDSVLPITVPTVAQATTIGSLCICHKQKLFVLSSKELKVATILSWADHILSLMQPATILDAIELTTSYYLGQSDASTLALPLDEAQRKLAVEPKLREILNASLDFIFSEERLKDGSHSDGETVRRLFERLVPVCIDACVALDDVDWLFDELYEKYEQNGIQDIFLERVEPFVLSGSVHAMPPSVSQRLIAIHEQRGQFDAIQRIIWHVSPEHIDINQALGLCQKHKLWDALIYVYVRALRDCVAPLVELIAVIRRIQEHRKTRPSRVGGDELDEDSPWQGGATESESEVPDAYKAFEYLSTILTGTSSPDGDPLDAKAAIAARNDVYSFLFSSRPVRWPAKGGTLVQTRSDNDEPSFPYLRLLLEFDTEALLDSLDAAFEDSYLNEDIPGRPLDRQLIVNLLLDLFQNARDDFSATDRTFLNIFVARNVPKYPQFIRLGPSVLESVLEDLARDLDLSTLDDRQLAAEYLLSVYTPSDQAHLVTLFEEASFFRILRSIYRGERKWAALASTYLRDPDVAPELFAHLEQVLTSARKSGNDRQRAELVNTIVEAVPSMVDAHEESLLQTAHLVDTHFPSRHSDVIAKLATSEWRQMAYLRCLLEPEAIPIPAEDEAAMPVRFSPSTHVDDRHKLRYLELLCKHQPQDVIRYVDASPAQLPPAKEMFDACEKAEAFDAVVWLIAKGGDVPLALKRTDEALESRTAILMHALYRGTQGDSDGDGVEEDESVSADRLVEQILAIEKAAIRVCLLPVSTQVEGDSPDERWFGLLSSLVDTVRAIRTVLPQPARPSDRSSSARRKVSGASIILHDSSDEVLSDWAAEQLSSLLLTALSTLVNSSTRVDFPKLVRRLIDVKARSPASDRAFSEFKAIVTSMLDTSASETEVLALSSRIVSQDLFAIASELARQRAYGWKPSMGTCAECCLPLWRASTTSNRTYVLFDNQGHERHRDRQPYLGYGMHHHHQDRPQQQQQQQNGASSSSMERSASIVKTIATSPERPKLRTSTSTKGKEVDWPATASGWPEREQEQRDRDNQVEGAGARHGGDEENEGAKGIVVRADGRVFHRACHLLALQRET